ncbi:MAG: hypothetical protein ABIB93_03255 [Chloroflexota bacterium]
MDLLGVGTGHNELAPALQGLETLSSGGFDMLLSSGAYADGVVPFGMWHNLPFSATFEELKEIWYETGASELTNKVYMDMTNTFVLGPEIQTNYIWLMKTGSPIKTLADYNGKKIRSPGGMDGEVQEALGAIPVRVTTGEMYTSFKTGVVDGGYLPAYCLETYKLGELCESVTMPTYGGLAAVWLWVNGDSWAKIPADLQSMMHDQMDNVFVDMRIAENHKVNEKDAAYMKDNNIRVDVLSKADLAARQKLVDPILESYATTIGPNGAALVKMLNDYRASNP